MVNKKLQKIGRKLDVSNKDIKSIRKAGLTRKIWYWIIGVGITVVSFILGFFINKWSTPSCPTCDPCLPCEPCGPSPSEGGYPFAVLAIPRLLRGRSKRSKIIILSMSMIAFLVAIKAYPIFGQAIRYNVYKR